MRKQYEMTTAQAQKIIDASQPVLYMIFGGIEPRSPQENANDAWEALGQELGFIWDTVRPVPGKSQMFFTAESITEQ
jgi:hypothetical protein